MAVTVIGNKLQVEVLADESTKTQLNEIQQEVGDLDKRVDTIITTPAEGVSAQEVIDARKGKASLRAKIDEMDTTVETYEAESTQQIEEVTKNPNYYKGAIVTIIDDDGCIEFEDTWVPVLNVTGAKVSIACITGNVGKQVGGYTHMTKERLLELQALGNEIVSHGMDGTTSTVITPEYADLSYSQAKQWLKDNGFKGYDTLVYAGGLHTERIEIKNIARKHYKHAIATSITDDYNLTPVDSWRVNRINGDSGTLASLKSKVDNAVLNNGWVIIMTHSHVLGVDGSAKMKSFIEYVQSLNVPIMTFGEAVKYKGNAVAIGEYTDKGTFISADGNVKLGNFYEQGTWTPKLEGETILGNHNYSKQIGLYTRIGNLVTITYDINIPVVGYDTTMSGFLRISGLPFTASNNDRRIDIFDYDYLTLGAGFTLPCLKVIGGTNYMKFFKLGSATFTNYIGATALKTDSNIVFRGQLTYQIS